MLSRCTFCVFFPLVGLSMVAVALARGELQTLFTATAVHPLISILCPSLNCQNAASNKLGIVVKHQQLQAAGGMCASGCAAAINSIGSAASGRKSSRPTSRSSARGARGVMRRFFDSGAVFDALSHPRLFHTLTLSVLTALIL